MTSTFPKKPKKPPARHHLDRRAEKLIHDGDGDADDLLDTREQSEWLGVSPQWLELGRKHGYGPPFVVLGPRIIRYRRGNTRAWLAERAQQTAIERGQRHGAEAAADRSDGRA